MGKLFVFMLMCFLLFWANSLCNKAKGFLPGINKALCILNVQNIFLYLQNNLTVLCVLKKHIIFTSVVKFKFSVSKIITLNKCTVAM